MSHKEVGEFAAIGREIGELVEQKNQAYGSAFQHSADLLKLFFPNGVQPHQYTDLLLIARISDKLFRIANKKDAFGESPYGDIIGYGILGKWNDDHLPPAGVAVPIVDFDPTYPLHVATALGFPVEVEKDLRKIDDTTPVLSTQ